MKLYNTKTLQVEEFVPRHPHEVNMYVCGPTVYNYSSIMFFSLASFLAYSFKISHLGSEIVYTAWPIP